VGGGVGGWWAGLHRMWQRFVLMFQRNVGAGGCCSKWDHPTKELSAARHPLVCLISLYCDTETLSL